MGGQVWGGGVIVLVSVLLWLVYLLPSWHSRRQFDAAERNAVRLNQALRVLAETSETPDEVRVELNTRTALAQQKLARRALAERESAALEQARIDLERARDARAAARRSPEARRARARRRTRLVATVVALAGAGVAVWGGVTVVLTGAQLLLWTGVGVALVGLLVLQRMSRVGARAAARAQRLIAAEGAAVVREAGAAELQDVELVTAERRWQPRDLPRPLTASAGSRAAAMLDAEAAREALRRAAREESLRERVEADAPPSIGAARAARESEFARMGHVDDAEIEAHVRRLLERRASGQ